MTNNDLFTVSDFRDYHLVLLGDIHKFQYLNKKKTIGYPGSMIQQNFGEDLLNHGYIRWDIRNKTSVFKRIKNDFGFLTLELMNDVLTEPKHIPKNPRIRLFHNEPSRSRLIKATKKLRKKYPGCDLNVIRNYDTKKTDIETKQTKDISIQDIKNPEVVVKIIKSYLDTREGDNKDVISCIHNILKKVKYDYNTVTRSISIHEISFSNLFLYEKNNIINLNNLKHITGIIAKNASGKSSIIDTILFAIYGKYSRGEKYQAVNTDESDAESEILLSVNNDIYRIIRKIHTTHKPNDRKNRNSIDIYKNGKRITDDDIKLTNQLIETLISGYDDLVNTSIILQSEKTDTLPPGLTWLTDDCYISTGPKMGKPYWPT